MTIQLGQISLQYDGLHLKCRSFHALTAYLGEQLRARRERIEQESVTTTIIRRWLITPVLAGVAVGWLLV